VNESGELTIEFKPNPNGNTPFLDQWLNKELSGSNWRANVTIKDTDRHKVTLSLLKSAYLFCFHTWGYDFVFSTVGELMRNVLNGKGEYPIQVPAFWLDKLLGNLPDDVRIPMGLCTIHYQQDRFLYLVNLPLQDFNSNAWKIASIPIAKHADTNLTELIEFQNAIDSGTLINFKINYITDYIINKGIYNGYSFGARP
jgi:hypothetical protein